MIRRSVIRGMEMRKRKKHINLIACLFLMGLLGLWGCGSPSSASATNRKPQGLAASQENSGADQMAETDGQGAEAGSSETDERSDGEVIGTALVYEGSMELQYAKHFSVDYYEGGYIMLTTTVDGAQFLVVPEDQPIPAQLDPSVVVLKQPIDHLYLVASAAMDMFRELEAVDRIRFSGQKEDGWYIEEAKEAMSDGSMLYAGKYNMPDYELIVSEGCSLAIENTMISHSPEVLEKLDEFGIPALIDYSSYETHPLGRVEWIRFYGALLGKEKEADAAFEKQLELLECVSKEEQANETEYVGAEMYADPTVAFFYITSNGTVNVRKTSDYVPQMIDLAGGSYIFQDLGSDEDHKSSVNMTMEQFYAAAKDADYLIYNSTIDGEIRAVEQLLGKSAMLRDFKAVKEGNVWCTTNDLYQHSMSVGGFILDLHGMLTGDLTQDYQYLYRLK